MSAHNKPAVWLAIAFSFGLSVWFGLGTLFAAPGGSVDLQAVFYPTRCLLQHHDPYNLADLSETYRAAASHPPSEGLFRADIGIGGFVYQPTVFPLLAPFVWMGWSIAWRVWAALILAGLLTSVLLMWRVASLWAPRSALILACLALANSVLSIASANPAGPAIAFCVVAVWCFLQNRLPLVGVTCMTLSLLLKPHDSALIWLFLLLAGGLVRRRAAQSFAVTAVAATATLAWVSSVAPLWRAELQQNLAAINTAGKMNNPAAISSAELDVTKTILDLQALVSAIFRNPGVYNPVCWAVCGLLLAAVSVVTFRRARSAGQLSSNQLWLGLTAVAPLALLAIYHRPYDARLLMLAIPGCALLARRPGFTGRISVALTAAAIFFTGDLTSALLLHTPDLLHADPATNSGRIVILLITRSGVVALLAMSLFHVAVYIRSLQSTPPPRYTDPQ